MEFSELTSHHSAGSDPQPLIEQVQAAGFECTKLTNRLMLGEIDGSAAFYCEKEIKSGYLQKKWEYITVILDNNGLIKKITTGSRQSAL